jgi:hypothetical protein
LLDAIILEKAGIPAVPIITDAFDNTAREMAELWGVPDFRFLMIPHPLGSLTLPGIEQRVEEVSSRVTEFLLQGQPD